MPAAFALAALAALGGCRAATRPTVTPASPVSSPPSPSIARLQRDLDQRLASPPLGHATWGVLVRSLARDETLYSRDAGKLLMPASGMKTVTLATAAERLGWDFSFETRVIADGSVDERFLNGDLVIVGSGDPSLDDWDGAATRTFEKWAATLKLKGIDTIGGRLVGDDNAIEDTRLGSGWAWDDLDRSYAASLGALQFNQNTTRLTVGPGTDESATPAAALAPEGSGLILRNQLKTAPADLPATLQTRRLAGSALLELSGAIPLGSAPVVRNVSVHNPTLYFLNALRRALVANGIDIRGPAVDIDDLQNPPTQAAPLILSYRSPPLSALAVTMMKQSQNLYAEAMMHAIGGPAEALSTLERWGISRDDILIADGSGLSRYNLVTAEVLVAILTHVGRDDRLRAPFAETLPVGGRDGTLAQRMKGSAAEGNVTAKTGSLSNARSLAGYLRTADGEPIVFAILANNFGVAPGIVEDAMDSMVTRLAEFRR